MRQERARTTSAAVLLAISLTFTGCGAGLSAPLPDVTVQGSGAPVTLKPFSYCWGTTCADGAVPRNPPDVGAAREVTVRSSEPGLAFTATFRRAGQLCGREQPATVTDSSATTHVLRPMGRAGVYDVMLEGRGAGGSLATAFRWRTPTAGPMPTPAARLSIIADNDMRVESSGVDLAIDNLARTPRTATAKVRVTSVEGKSLKITPQPVDVGGGCLLEGSVHLVGSDAQGKAAAALGGPPFSYEVTLVLDGASYRATAAWPADVIPDSTPSVGLRFTPALPALTR